MQAKDKKVDLKAVLNVPITKEFAKQVSDAFPDNPVKDDMNLLQIGRMAGRKEVVAYILRHVRTSGVVSEDTSPKKTKRWIDRLIGNTDA